MTAANLHLRWAELVVDGLVAGGVRHVVLSPGSRSTPLVVAVARRRELAVTVLVDERVAGFFALGQGRATGRPSVLLCTSGTAGAHYLPAVLEADEAGVPLVVVTADRPPELHHRMAAQTTVQRDFFGGHTRLLHDLGAPSPDPAALAGVREVTALAAARAMAPRPGPVHLNAPFRKPLEGVAPNAEDGTLQTLVEGLCAGPLPAVWAAEAKAAPAAVQALAAALSAAPRGVILAGPAPLAQAASGAAVEALAGRLGYPILAEAASQLRRRGAAPVHVELLDLLAPDPRVPRPGAPELVLQLGRPVTSATWQRCFEGRPEVQRWVLGGEGWPDPWGGATGIVAGDPAHVAAALLAELGEGQGADPAWAAAWRRTDELAREVVDGWLAQEAAAGHLSELAVACAVLRAVPPGGRVVVGNSLAAREVDLAPPPAPGVGVLHQRGVAGIDGLISGAAGAAAVSGGPTVLLLGDLAALHDVGGLAAAKQVRSPLVVVVLANRGGRLFELLPLAGSGLDEGEVERLFLAPMEVRLAQVAPAFGLPARRAGTVAELDGVLQEALAHPGATVVEAVISGPSAGVRWRALRERARAVRRE